MLFILCDSKTTYINPTWINFLSLSLSLSSPFPVFLVFSISSSRVSYLASFFPWKFAFVPNSHPSSYCGFSPFSLDSVEVPDNLIIGSAAVAWFTCTRVQLTIRAGGTRCNHPRRLQVETIGLERCVFCELTKITLLARLDDVLPRNSNDRTNYRVTLSKLSRDATRNFYYSLLSYEELDLLQLKMYLNFIKKFI